MIFSVSIFNKPARNYLGQSVTRSHTSFLSRHGFPTFLCFRIAEKEMVIEQFRVKTYHLKLKTMHQEIFLYHIIGLNRVEIDGLEFL